MEKITVWEVFFMLLTVIPVSKMLSSIFMNLVARVGTVDEDRWAMIGLGAIGATFGLMKKGGMLGGLTGGAFGGGNNMPPPTGGVGITPPNPPVPPVGPGLSNFNANSPGMSGQTTNMSGFNESGYNTFTTDTTGQNNNGNGMQGQLFNQVGGGVSNQATAAGVSPKEGISNSAQPFEQGGAATPPPMGQRNLNDIINISGKAGNKAAGNAAKFGAASSFAVPEAAPAVAGIYAATGKAMGGVTSTAYNLAGEIRARKANGQGFLQSMRDITGSQNNVAATTQVAMALAMSPMGSRAASMGASMTGRAMTPNINGIKKNN
ncbi:hypothetical protein SAMN05660649_04827 [Desulfotomaculum arcticum]|uniref:Uncharacterized protein n=1 Tax=Desulfotruncus arcticus DSM 17038 TaxID=1121424 RepID=A0A1I2Z918_9FIRM|nr:hypothetical protein [Desulfotruncus arcticus]SFH34342.1 hypothetical protein SAMN05660649_04827 [Desulfotomaculum arcticum] [Desulfotruncus arcticus DSM 17038]